MDQRIALAEGTALAFPGMTCIIEREMGRGSNAIVYRGWYADALHGQQRHQVLVKELFPFHECGAIHREEGGLNVVCEEAGKATLALHTDSFVWGNGVHLALREKHPDGVGGNLNTYALNNTYYTLLDFSGGRDLQAELSGGKAVSLRKLVQRMLGVLDALSLFHEAGYLHLDVSPDNILLIGEDARERVELIDYNSVVTSEDLTSGKNVRLSVKAGFASPEVRMQKLAAMGAWTDLYAVTAVLFYGLMGRPLERMEQSGIRPADVQGSACLADAPDTVRSKVRQILQKGLATTPAKRYATTDAMRADLHELLDRIDGVGVTHWALWEVSSQTIRREIKQNPALSYLVEDGALYPTAFLGPEGCSMEAFLAGRGHVMLTGGGGMGKTTLLMRTVYDACQSYRRDRAAVMYLPLHGYQPGDAHFIHDSLLRRLKFKADMAHYEDARHALDLLMQKPLRTRTGEVPALCLLLDGYNEIAGDTQALRREIEQLAGMDGVRLMITSRSPLAEYAYEEWRMQPLPAQAVRRILGENNLLIPQSAQMRELLSNAMMLSLFVRACKDSEEQLTISTREELVAAYLDALLAKELRALPENAAMKWQMIVAVRCVYPLMAHAQESRGMLSDAQMLEQLGRLYSQLSSRAVLKKFPDWIGHAAQMKGDAQDEEAWYGLIVHHLLWQRLGLLKVDEHGAYRMAHQEFMDALCGEGREIEVLLRRKTLVKRAALLGACLAACAALAAGALMTWSMPYDSEGAVYALQEIGMVYQAHNQQHTAMTDLLADEQPTVEDFTQVRKKLKSTYLEIAYGTKDREELAEKIISRVEDQLGIMGERFPWNDLSFDTKNYEDMIKLIAQRRVEYLGDDEEPGMVDVLEEVYLASQEAQSPEAYMRCLWLVQTVLDADACVSAAYNHLICRMRAQGLPQWESRGKGRARLGTNWIIAHGYSFTEEMEAFKESIWNYVDEAQMQEELVILIEEAQKARGALAQNADYVNAKMRLMME